MRFVAETVLPVYLRELERALDAALPRAPEGRVRRALGRLCRRVRRAVGSSQDGLPPVAVPRTALEGLLAAGEAEGWLSIEEAILIRKLAFRVGFYARRARGEGGSAGDRGVPW